MGIEVNEFGKGNGLRLVINGTLDAAAADQAITACDQLRDTSWERLEVELVGSSQVDMAGLELLLLLQERSRERRSIIRLVACHPEVKRKLDIAGFRRRFVICESAPAFRH